MKTRILFILPLVLLLLMAGLTAVSAQTIYQSENGTWSSGSGVYTTYAGYTGTGYVNTANMYGSWAQVTVTAPTAGSYIIQYRYANGTTTNRPCDIYVNGTKVISNLAFSGTGAWTTWGLTSQQTVTLNAGSNTIRARATTSNGTANLDYLSASASTIPVTGVSVAPTSASINVGATVQLTATVSPSNATNKSITWSSNNTSAATVNSSGLVTGVAGGTATITVTTVEGGFTATSAITVNISSYTITATSGANGSVTPAGVTTVNSGGSQSYAITASAGYHITDVLVDGASVGAVTSYSFTNVTATHTISASFAIDTYTITATSGANGTVTPAGVTTVNYNGSQSYAITPATGYHIADVLVDGASVGAVSSYSFSNIAANHTISATFTQNEYTLTINKVGNGTVTADIAAPYHYGDVVTLSATADAGWTFAGISPSAVVTMDDNKSVTATFTQNEYTLTINKVGNGTVTADIAAPYHYGDVVTLSATADAGWTFAGISPSAVVTMDDNKSVTATFTQNEYTLTINKVGNGTVTADIAAPYHYGDVVTLSATADAGWTFAGISPSAVVTMDDNKSVTATFTQNEYTLTINKVGNGTVTADIAAPYHYGDVVTLSATADAGWTFAGISPSAVVTMDDNKSVTATFTQNEYTLTINKVGNGTVTADIAAPYHYGDVVTLSATADAGWTFAGISPSAVVTMDDNKTVTATFTQNEYTLTINKVGNGTVTADIAAPYHYGDVVTLSATADAGWTFAGISPSAVVTMDDNKSVTATFTQNEYTLTINKVGNGTVTADIAAPYHYGDVVTLSATADAGWTFAGISPSAVVTMDDNKSVTATFTQNEYTLTINKVGNGTVTADIAAPYHYGDVVTLSATADAGWTFAGISPSAVVTMDDNKSVTATFTQNEYTLTINKVGNGTVTADIAAPYHYGDVVTLSATADAGWTFAGISPSAVVTMDDNKSVTATFTQNEYTLTINKVGNGTVTADIAAPYHYGDVVTLSATADAGWTFAGISPSAVVTMDDNKSVTATFTQNEYTLTINKVGNGTVTADIAAPYHYGDVVTLSATADAGWTFAGISPSAVVTMDDNKSVTATFTQNEYTLTINKVGNGTVTADIAAPYHYGDVVTLSATADAGWTFAGISPSAVVTMDDNKTVTATFTQNEYTLTINKVGNGTVTADIAAPYHYGDVVTLSATADAGWTFAGISPSAVVTMDDNKSVTATFTQNEYTLTINKVGNGTVTADIAAPYHYGDVVTLSATADAGWTFAGISPSAVVTMDDNKTVTATFTQNEYTLTINKVGNGTVTADIAAPYHYGDVVTLSATADAGWTFAGISPSAVVTMDDNKTVTATFTIAPKTITSNGTGGGDWNTATTWIGGVVPTSIDNAIVQGSDVVTLIAAGTCSNLTLNAGTTLSLNAASLTIPGTSWNFATTSTVVYNSTTTVQSAPVYGNLVYASTSSGGVSTTAPANLTINGNLTITAGTFRGIASTSGSVTHTVAGNVIIGPGIAARISGVNNSAATTASCTWNIGGNVSLTGNNTGNRIIFYESAGPHSGSGVFNIGGNLSIGTGSQVMLKSSSATTNNFPEGIVNLKGNLVQNGPIGVNSGSGISPGLSMNFVGTSAQDWSGSGAFVVSTFSVNVNINNAAGVTLSSPRIIPTNTGVTLNNGKLTTSSTNLLTINGGAISGGSSSSFISGPLARVIATGAQSPVYPIGDAATYAPVTVAIGSVATSGTLTAATTSGIHPQIGTSGLESSKTLNRYYTITNSGTTFDSYTATLNFDAADVIGGANTANYIVKKYDGAAWSTPTTANALATSIQTTGLTSFSDFAVGEIAVYTITATSGANGTVTPEGVTVVNYNGSQDYAITPATGYHIADVLVDGASVGTVASYSFSNVAANHTISATFTQNEYTLTINKVGNGTVTADIAAPYHYGDVVTLSATADAGWTFAGISPSAVVTMDDNKSVTATFTQNEYTLTINKVGNGTVTADIAAPYHYGDVVTLSATADAGWTFAGISPSAVVTMDDNKTVTATFTIAPKTITSNGTGGGDWNTATTWIGGVVPTSIDNAIVQGSDVVTLIAAGTCTNLTLNAGTTLSLNAASLVIPGTSWNFDVTSTVIYNGTTTVQSAPVYGNLTYVSSNGGPNGSLTVLGNITVSGTGALRGISATSGTYTHNVAGNVILSNASAKISGVNSSNATTASCTWNIGGNVLLTGNGTNNRVILYESAGPHTGSAVYNINGNLSIGTGSQIMLKSSSTTTNNFPEGIVNLKGNLVQNGPIGVNSGTGTSPGLSMNFVGTSAQDWSGSGLFSVSTFSVNVNINNAAGVTLSSPRDIPIRTAVILTNGKLTTTSTNLLTISAGSISGGSSSSFISGPLARVIATGAQSPVYPIGDAATYAPVTVAIGSVATSGTLTAATTSGIHPQIGTSGLESSKTLNRYYTITNSGTTFDSYTATLNFDAADVIGGANTANYIVKKYDGAAWSTPTTANALATSIQTTGLTSFSDFAVGEAAPPVPSYTLTVTATNGSVAKSPDQASYDSASTVQLTAAPAIGYQFTGWSGDLTGTTNPVNVTMDANKNVTANFVLSAVTIPVSIVQGWNLLSVPVAQPDSTPSVVFPGHLGDIFEYDAATNSYQPALSVRVGVGYWVYYTSAQVVNITGPVVGPIRITCVLGWNLIGGREVPVNASALTTDPAGLILGDIFRNTPTGYEATTVLAPVEGFWIYVTGACMLTIP